MRFQTNTCSRHSHPEISFVFAERVPVPGAERLLLDYFESSVAQGVVFKAGQKVGIGGSLLRLFDRGDRTLGVRDVGPDGQDAEPESAHRSVMRTWLRQEVARSFGLEADFPATTATAILCTHTDQSTHALLLKRMSPTPNSPDSGWFIGCTDQTHDHDAKDALVVAHILAIAEKYPWLDQFFALPLRTDLVVEMEDRVRVPVLWYGDQADPRPPLAGSYVAALNAAT